MLHRLANNLAEQVFRIFHASGRGDLPGFRGVNIRRFLAGRQHIFLRVRAVTHADKRRFQVKLLVNIRVVPTGQQRDAFRVFRKICLERGAIIKRLEGKRAERRKIGVERLFQ